MLRVLIVDEVSAGPRPVEHHPFTNREVSNLAIVVVVVVVVDEELSAGTLSGLTLLLTRGILNPHPSKYGFGSRPGGPRSPVRQAEDEAVVVAAGDEVLGY